MKSIQPIQFVLLLTVLVAGCVTKPPQSSRGLGIQPGHTKQALLDGNERFLQGGVYDHSWQHERVIRTGEFGQSPSVGLLSCADSRVPPETIFDQGVGDLFVVRVAGNIDNADATGTFEYGFKALGMNSVVVLGHTKCGAVQAAIEGKPLPGNIQGISDAIQPALTDLRTRQANMPPEAFAVAAAEANARWQLKELLARSSILRQAVADGELAVFCAIYDVDTGRVRFLD